jgi:hypothetical protein
VDLSQIGAEILGARDRVGTASHAERQEEVGRVLPGDSRTDREVVRFVDHFQVPGSVISKLEACDRQSEPRVVVRDVDQPVVLETGMKADVQQATEHVDGPGLGDARDRGHLAAHVVIECTTSLGEQELLLADDRDPVGNPVPGREDPWFRDFVVRGDGRVGGEDLAFLAGRKKREPDGHQPQTLADPVRYSPRSAGRYCLTTHLSTASR